ncbi:hypothetical protein AB2L28_14680 [Kineococcus sp. TBRC 1896]|uniref:Uncharacterized protein n=1 Tax=Kineococcus mangrovi TaxID=1660183 RepID=A0ABV4I889_9ACTN
MATARRARARFSIAVRHNPAVRQVISTIADDARTPTEYTDAVWDEDDQRWVSDAEVTETTCTAFTGRRLAEHVSARSIVRRVERLDPEVARGQGELFDTRRHHAVFTDSPAPVLEAEKSHRAHAIVESTIAELTDNTPAHLPSGQFQTDGAWLILAVTTHDPTRAVAVSAGAGRHSEQMGTTRRKSISPPSRLASSARRFRLHAPRVWRWQVGFDDLTAALAVTASVVPRQPRPTLRT